MVVCSGVGGGVVVVGVWAVVVRVAVVVVVCWFVDGVEVSWLSVP